MAICKEVWPLPYEILVRTACMFFNPFCKYLFRWFFWGAQFLFQDVLDGLGSYNFFLYCYALSEP